MPRERVRQGRIGESHDGLGAPEEGWTEPLGGIHYSGDGSTIEAADHGAKGTEKGQGIGFDEGTGQRKGHV